MKKKLLSLLLFLVSSVLLVSCGAKTTKAPTTTKDNYDYSGNPLADEQVKLNSFSYGDVVINDGLYKDTFESCMEYYMGLEVDDIFYTINRIVDPTCTSGENINIGNGGNVLGQWMQAFARLYDATKSEEVLKKCQDIMTAMNRASLKYPMLIDGENSYYCFEKYVRGFVDMYRYTGISEAYDCAKRMVDSAMASSNFKNPTLALGNNGGDVEIEWYTIAESLLEFANTAKEKGGLTSKEINDYYNFAKKFAYTEFYNIFLNNESIYDYSPETGINIQYFHAYSHVNTFNSAAALYRKTGDEDYLNAMINFYSWLEQDQMLSTGGYGCHTEWLAPRSEQIGFLQSYHDNFETQCNSYAIYRLDNNMANFTGKSHYLNETEKLLYNGTIASLETARGYAFYYSDYCTSGGSKQLKTDWKWSCCTGTRPLAVLEILRSIYFNDTENLYVALFTNSSIDWKRGSDHVKLTQTSNYPYENTVNFTVETDRTDKFAIKIRDSLYKSAPAVVKVNGTVYEYKVDKNGWIDLNRVWSNGDTIEITIPMELSTTKIEEELYYGDDGVWALNYGPVSLALTLPLGIKPSIVKYETIISSLVKGKDDLHYSYDDDGIMINFKPYFEYKEGEGYYLYFNLYNNSIFD